MKPYYQDTYCTIYNGDCRDVLPLLSPVDLVLTDPPYGIGDRMQGGTWGAKEKYADFRKWDVAPLPETLAAACALGRQVIVWGGNYFALGPSRCWLVWDKRNAVPTMADCELAWTNLDKPAKRLSLGVGVHVHGHPTEKPLPLFAWCISQAVDVRTIVDPFMGSGTSLRAAKNRCIRSVGIEIDEWYCEIAASRLSQESLNFGQDEDARAGQGECPGTACNSASPKAAQESLELGL
jgi:DNA modification methylase